MKQTIQGISAAQFDLQTQDDFISAAWKSCRKASIVEDIAIILVKTLGGRRPGILTPPHIHDNFLMYLASSGMWKAATFLLDSHNSGAILLSDTGGYTTMLNYTNMLGEMDSATSTGQAVHRSGKKLALTPEQLTAALSHSEGGSESGCAAAIFPEDSQVARYLWAHGNIFDFKLVHPAFFAMRANSSEAQLFVTKYFKIFPSTPLDIISALLFGRHIATSTSGTILQHWLNLRPSDDNSSTYCIHSDNINANHFRTYEQVLAAADVLQVPITHTYGLKDLCIEHALNTFSLAIHGVRKSFLPDIFVLCTIAVAQCRAPS